MMEAASELGHIPATLSIMRAVYRTNDHGRSPFPRTEAKFRKLVNERHDANTMTLQGMFLEKATDTKSGDTAAVLAFIKARQLGEAAEAAGGTWEWKADCLLGIGRLMVKEGRMAEAEALFKQVAFEMDVPDGYYELGMIQDIENLDLQHEYIQKAAVNGSFKALMFMPVLESKRSEEALKTGDKKAFKAAQAWRFEWMELRKPPSSPTGNGGKTSQK
jgi:hypothetical protein